LLFHAALAIFVWLQVARAHEDHGKDCPREIDTRVTGPAGETEICCLLVDDRPRPKAEPAPPPAAPPATQQFIKPPPGPAPPAAPSGGPGETAHPGHSGTPAGHGGPTTAFFHIATPAKTIVYVIDRSTSMGLHGTLPVAQRELTASLELLPPDAHFQVICYNRTAEPLGGGADDLLAATAENKRQVAAAVNSLQAEGGTEHLRALQRALLLRPEVIFFLTDADDLKPEEVRTVIRLNQGRTAIHAIELSDTARHQDDNMLYLLARLNRGLYRAENIGSRALHSSR
jgi:hypothetical protein